MHRVSPGGKFDGIFQHNFIYIVLISVIADNYCAVATEHKGGGEVCNSSEGA